MAQTHKLSQMDIQPGGVQDHYLQNVLKFGFGDWKNVYRKSALFRHFWFICYHGTLMCYGNFISIVKALKMFGQANATLKIFKLLPWSQ